MMQAAAVAETGLTITNPLVLYRTLVATKKIEPDPAQHRLALHLQKLYYRLKDYEPSIEYKHRLAQVARAVGPSAIIQAQTRPQTDENGQAPEASTSQGFFQSLRSQKRAEAEQMALTRTLTNHEAAMQMDSPQGLLLYGEVGTGKSFLVDLLADSLPNRKKRRAHFNAFMLDTFARLEQQRIQRSGSARLTPTTLGMEHEHTLLSVARDMVTVSPILFLDEFQLPDRASSKILSSLFTSFFQLGGVLIATSNRMPEELSKASGVEFAAPQPSSGRIGLSGLRRLFGNPAEDVPKNMFSRESDFAQFLDVLKARCETWNMESKTDFRRRDSVSSLASAETIPDAETFETGQDAIAAGATAADAKLAEETTASEHSSLPPYFFQQDSDLLSSDSLAAESLWHATTLQAVDPSMASLGEIPWREDVMNVYGRKVRVPKAYNNTCLWSFEQLCGTYLGPADYITLASTYDTIVLDEVPILKFLQKNEARRFITLLDALYEARCKLLIRAAAGPDELFFPDMRGLTAGLKGGQPGKDAPKDIRDDSVYAETFSEIYQDQTAPFRPNISSYEGGGTAGTPEEHYTNTAAERTHGAHPMTKSILADEDADFGPVYGAGRSAGASSFDPAEEDKRRQLAGLTSSGPNFQRASAFTGEDEKFAYRRAESRLWELCSRRWWESAARPGWWRPLSKDARSWEEDGDALDAAMKQRGVLDEEEAKETEAHRDRLFRHGASPFRTHRDPPPKIPWTHTWGMMTWGRKAGTWGKGTEGIEERLEERKEEKRKEEEMLDRIKPKPRP